MVTSLTIATVIRVFLVIISYGCKVPAGIFVPSMAIGASFGRTVGILVQALHEAAPNSKFFSSCEPDIPVSTCALRKSVSFTNMRSASHLEPMRFWAPQQL
jgi:chloride channel 3/4/5